MYTKLQGDQIRLLRLERQPIGGNSEGQITGSLEVVNLDSSSLPMYTALSYAWASDQLTDQIIIAGQPHAITANLFAMLSRLSRTTPSQSIGTLGELLSRQCTAYLWIDAICINQSEGGEKTSQVRMMAKIYRKASLTLMWLGEDTDSSRIALEWLTTIASLEQILFDTFSDQEKLGLFNESAWNGLCDFLLRSYFRRRWIIEEAALSPEPWIICGQQTISWELFETGYGRTCGVLYNLIFLSKRTVKKTDIDVITAISNLRNRLQTGNDISLLELLIRFRRSNSVKARDRIFALLGLCSFDEASHIRLDYQEHFSLEHLFKQQVVAHIKRWKNLDFLCVSQERVRIERRTQRYRLPNGIFINPDPPGWAVMIPITKLPTWTPNWTSPHCYWDLGPEDYTVDAVRRPIFSAARGTLAEVINLDNAAAGDHLLVRGLHVDTVFSVEKSTPPPNPDQWNPQSIFYINCWMLHQQFPLQLTPYGSEFDRLDAFWRTITLGGRGYGTNELYSMDSIRYFCHEFFQDPAADTLFGKLLEMRGFGRRSTQSPQHINSDRPSINLDKFLAFKFFVTNSGRMGMGPAHTAVGDQVCILYGCSSPILLNMSGNGNNELHVRGEAYVDGYMWGEAMAMVDDKTPQVEYFTLA